MFGFIGAAIGAVCSVVSAAVVSFVSVAGVALAAAGTVMLKAVQVGLPFLEKVCTAISLVGQILEIIDNKEPEKDVIDLGRRAELASEQGIRSEQFENYQGYINHLRHEIKADKLEMEKLTAEEKIKYSAIGSAVTMKGIDAKFNVSIPNDFWLAACKMNLAKEDLHPLLTKFDQQGVSPNLSGFQERKLSSQDNEKIYHVLEGYLQENNSSQTVASLINKN